MQTTRYFTLEDHDTPKENRTWRVLKDTRPRPNTTEWAEGNLYKCLWPQVAAFTGPHQESMAQAKALVDELNNQEFARIQAAGPLTRYRTNWYVNINETEARRQAVVDKTPWEKVKITQGVTLIHCQGDWSLWSDGIVKAGGLNLKGGSLTKDTVRLISMVLGADGGYVEGGIERLANVQEIVSEETVTHGAHRGLYAAERIERLHVRWLDGSEGELFAHTAGYFEGYQYDLYASLESLREKASPAPGPEGITVFPPDDFDYDPELGFTSRDPE